MATHRVPKSVRVRGSRSWWSWWWLDRGFRFASWILMFFLASKGCWMHDQGQRKRSSLPSHMHGKPANTRTPVATSWKSWSVMRLCLWLLSLLTSGSFLIMCPYSNSNVKKRPKSEASGAQWQICTLCMPMKAP